MKTRGKIHEFGEIFQFDEKASKRDLIVELSDWRSRSYVEYVRFEIMHNRYHLLKGLKIGDEVDVFFDIRGRGWTNKEGETKYFNTLQIYNLIKI